MKSLSSFFSFTNRRSALVLGTTLGVSLLFAGVTFAQSLNIPNAIDNTAITIKKIFLSPTGTNTDQGKSRAYITLDGEAGIINVEGAPEFGIDGTVNTTALNTTNLTVANSVFFEGMNCGTMVANPADIGGTRAVRGGESGGGNSSNQTVATQTITALKEIGGGGPIITPPMNNPKCFLMIDASGEVTIIPDFRDDENTNESDTPVFKRSTTNPSDSYFATTDGEEATVGSDNFLRIGTAYNNAPTKNDAAMVVGGSIESRGGNFIKKADGQASNQGDNLNVSIGVNYTSLDTKVESGKIMFEASRKGANPFAILPTNFVFSSLLSTTKVGINNDTPTKTLDVVGNAGITEYLAVGHPSSFVPTTTDKLFVNGTTRANAYYYNSDARYKANIAIVPNALEKLSALHGYSYYNKLTEKNDVGVIAQEVEKVFPELVQTDTEGYKSVSYGNLVAPLIQAVNELAKKVDALTVSMNDLFDKYVSQQSQIDSLTYRIQALESVK